MHLEIGQIITQIIAFLMTLWILKKFAWKPLLHVLEERKKKIKLELDFIEEQKRHVKAQIDLYNEKLKDIEELARSRIHEAVTEGQKIAQDIQGQAYKQAKGILDKAHHEVERELSKAKIQLKNDLINMTIAATQKIIQEELNTEKQKKLIHEFVEKL